LHTKGYNMATPIRPIPTLYGEDAKKFVEAAEAAERNPHTIDLGMNQEEAVRIWNKIFKG